MSMSPEEKAEFLQIYLDETEEELDALVETLLVLENEPDSRDHLNEAFRMVHSMKGAAGMMGFQDITALTHQLESRFEKLRSRTVRLDQPTMAVALKCVDFLRQCNEQLRQGEPFSSVGSLLKELHALDPPPLASATPDNLSEDRPPQPPTESRAAVPPPSTAVAPEPRDPPVKPTGDAPAETNFHVSVTFEPGMKLLDMKGQLVVTRVEEVGEVLTTRPPVDELSTMTGPVTFELLVATERESEDVADAADVFGVTSVALQPVASRALPPIAETESNPSPAVVPQREAVSEAVVDSPDARGDDPPSLPTTGNEGKTRVAETVRVEIDRLDNLLNLAGELVVNKARFSQIASRMNHAYKQGSTTARFRSFGESLRVTLAEIRQSAASGDVPLGVAVERSRKRAR